MDVHARTITVKGIDGSTAATAAKRFDDVPAPSEIASWMQGEFTAPGMPSTKACVSSRGFEQKEHRKLSSLSIGSAHAF
ncbi:hypothetical protein DMP05_09625 [Slackia isoflavoniconvertens]|uniref:Uncharacterized protein n=1 Tax=Slackia isoflavoniconvertens TaxID=572010 RepID=A0A3N0I7N1_9ACTN|nr:hypothetical protein DMP05_09625 [Slackia isoflavoniconvertens]